MEREKIIQEFDFLIRDFCPSCTSDERYLEVLKAVRELLKEQEAIEPITEHHLFLCPVCKNTLFREQKFCHECGKRIEWEEKFAPNCTKVCGIV